MLAAHTHLLLLLSPVALCAVGMVLAALGLTIDGPGVYAAAAAAYVLGVPVALASAYLFCAGSMGGRQFDAVTGAVGAWLTS